MLICHDASLILLFLSGLSLLIPAKQASSCEGGLLGLLLLSLRSILPGGHSWGGMHERTCTLKDGRMHAQMLFVCLHPRYRDVLLRWLGTSSFCLDRSWASRMHIPHPQLIVLFFFFLPTEIPDLDVHVPYLLLATVKRLRNPQPYVKREPSALWNIRGFPSFVQSFDMLSPIWTVQANEARRGRFCGLSSSREG